MQFVVIILTSRATGKKVPARFGLTAHKCHALSYVEPELWVLPYFADAEPGTADSGPVGYDLGRQSLRHTVGWNLRRNVGFAQDLPVRVAETPESGLL
jgi:hypothetical protein